MRGKICLKDIVNITRLGLINYRQTRAAVEGRILQKTKDKQVLPVEERILQTETT